MKAIITIKRDENTYFYATLKTDTTNAIVTERRIWCCDIVDRVKSITKALEVLGYEVEIINEPAEEYNKKTQH